MSYRFYLGPTRPSNADDFDEVASGGSDLRTRTMGYTGPFRLTVGDGAAPAEVEAFFADGDWPQPEDFWTIYIGDRRGSSIEHPSMAELRAALEG